MSMRASQGIGGVRADGRRVLSDGGSRRLMEISAGVVVLSRLFLRPRAATLPGCKERAANGPMRALGAGGLGAGTCGQLICGSGSAGWASGAPSKLRQHRHDGFAGELTAQET
jgi:hypothetical protein